MRRFLIPLAIAGALGLAMIIVLGRSSDSDRRSSSGGGLAADESGAGGRGGGQRGSTIEFDPIDPTGADLPPNELLLDPQPIEPVPAEDASLDLSALPGATWEEIEKWFRDRATHDERIEAAEEILAELSREDALDRILTLARAMTDSPDRADTCFALGDLLVPTVLNSSAEVTRFRRILTKGKDPSERFVALPIIQKSVEVIGETVGAIEAYELAFYSISDGEFAQVLLAEVGRAQAPTRAIRLFERALVQGKETPGNGYFLAAVEGAYSILAAEKVARRKIAARELPPGHALIREYQLADRLELRKSVIDQVSAAALDGKRTESEFLAALDFLRAVAPRRVDVLRDSCEQPELLHLFSAGGN